MYCQIYRAIYDERISHSNRCICLFDAFTELCVTDAVIINILCVYDKLERRIAPNTRSKFWRPLTPSYFVLYAIY
jgi:hypothetical protein